MDTVLQDLKYALRTLSRAPAFTAAATLALALGIGGSSAMFSVLDSVVLRPLPAPHAEQLVRLYEVSAGGHQGPWSTPDYLDLAKENGSFQSVAAVRTTRASITVDAGPVQSARRPRDRELLRDVGRPSRARPRPDAGRRQPRRGQGGGADRRTVEARVRRRAARARAVVGAERPHLHGGGGDAQGLPLSPWSAMRRRSCPWSGRSSSSRPGTCTPSPPSRGSSPASPCTGAGRPGRARAAHRLAAGGPHRRHHAGCAAARRSGRTGAAGPRGAARRR